MHFTMGEGLYTVVVVLRDSSLPLRSFTMRVSEVVNPGAPLEGEQSLPDRLIVFGLSLIHI